MMVEVQWYGNSDELLLSPSVAFCLPPWIMLNINLVLETCVSISSCFVHEAYVWMKVVTSFNSCASDASCRRGFEKVNVASSGIIASQSCTRAKYSVVWRLATFIPYVYPSTPSHWLICSRRRSIFIRANPDLWKNFDILADGSQPELDSVLL